jgi:hypothetical protein
VSTSDTASQTYYACLLFYVGCTADAEVAAETFGDDDALTASALPARFGSPPEMMAGMVRLPGRAKGEEIPLPVRIASVARDAAFQRLLGGAEHAAGVIRKRAGGAFGPAVWRVRPSTAP